MKESSSSQVRHGDSQFILPKKWGRQISLNHNTATLPNHKHTIPSVTQPIYLCVLYSRRFTKSFRPFTISKFRPHWICWQTHRWTHSIEQTGDRGIEIPI